MYLKFGPASNGSGTNPKPPAYNVGNEAGQHWWSRVYDDAPFLESDSVGGTATFNLPDSFLPASQIANGIQDLWSSYDVLVEATLDSTFQAGIESATFTTLPPLAEIRWVDGEQNQMGLSATLSNKSGVPQTVYYRWREVGTTTWNTGEIVVPWGNPQTETYRLMTGLTSHTQYEAEASLDPNFPADKTMTQTAYTYEPEMVRMGVRKVTATEAVITGIMDIPNGREYKIGCQARIDEADSPWSPLSTSVVDDRIGSTALESLPGSSESSSEDYKYRCRLTWDVGAFGPDGRNLPEQATQTLDGTSTALTEIGASISGTTATITVKLANTDGTNNDVYLRHRIYPSEEWSHPAGIGTLTDTATFVTSVTGDNLYEYTASLDENFADAKKVLTLYLTADSTPTTTPTPNPTPDPNDDTNDDNQDTNDNNEVTEDPNNNNVGGGTLPNNNNTNSGGSSSGGGFGGGGIVQRNTAPNFRDSAGKMRTVPENSEEDVKVGEVIMAWDPENDQLTFSLRGDDAAPFKIETLKGGYSGQLLVGPDAGLDYEAQSVYTVTVVATDPGGEERTLDIEVQLIDVKLPGKADIFDVQNNHDEWLDQEEVLAAAAAYGLRLITQLEMIFIMKYFYDTNFGDVDFDNLPSMTDKYDINADSIIDRAEMLAALDDFMDGKISKAAMQEVVKTYYGDGMVGTESEATAAT